MRQFKKNKLLSLSCKLIALMVFTCISAFAQAQERTVSGVVSDNSGLGLPGVNVTIKGTTIGVVTDIDGKFSIKVPGSDAVLTISYVGYKTQELAVGEQTSINATLQEDVQQLNEVVVIGYGVQKRSDLTGAVASVSSKDIAKTPLTSAATALQGRAAGVQVNANTGAPGANVTIRVRGISSFNTANGGGQAIWIVDGVPSGANSVSPSDIESIEVLKDGASAAIYGSSGGSGVVLITTKKGKAGKIEANLNYYHGWQENPSKIDVANGPQFAQMYTELQSILKKKDYKFTNLDSVPSYDYQDMIFRSGKNAPMDNLDFNVSGGTEKSNFYMGIGYQKTVGILKGTEFQKANFRLNSDHKINTWLKVGQTFSFNQRKNDGFEEWQYKNEYESPIIAALSFHPYIAPYDSTGNWIPKQGGASDSPLPKIDLLEKQYNNYESNGMFYTQITPVKGLTLESRISGGLSFGNNYDFLRKYWYGAGPGQNNPKSQIRRGMDKYFGYTWQNLATYQTTIMNDFNFLALAGFEVGESQSENIAGYRENLLTEAPEMWYFDAGRSDTTQTNRGSASKSAGYSYLGRINLDWKSTILLQGNFRRDYSSKFGPKNRAGNFPGFSVGLKFTEFDFIKDNVPLLTFGKIRYSYGKNGNNAIPDNVYYATVGVYDSYSYALNNSASLSLGAGPDILANKAVKWESIVQHNFGIDLTFFDNRLSISAEKFNRYNDGMLIFDNIPGYAGWVIRDNYQEAKNKDPRPMVNLGEISNKGYEFSVGWKDEIGKLRYDFNINYTYVKNVCENLSNDSIRYGGKDNKGISGYLTRTVVGQEIGEFYGYEIEGLFQASDTGTNSKGKKVIVNQPYTINTKGEKVYAQPDALPGDFKFKDVNNDGKITDDDMVAIGNPNPRHLFGFSMNLEYGWFDFNMFWEGVLGNEIFNAAKWYGFNQDGGYNWNPDYIANHYRENEIEAIGADGTSIAIFTANQNAKYPRLDPLNKNGNFSKPSSFFIEDGSYLRLKSLQLGLNFPSKWFTKVQISGVRVYVGAQNLLTFTNYSGMEPEVPQTEPLVSGIDKASYPLARMYTAGISVKF